MHDEVVAAVKKRVTAMYALWKSDPAGFRDSHPDIQISISVGQDPRVGALRSIAKHIMKDNVRYGWDVIEILGHDPEFWIVSID